MKDAKIFFERNKTNSQGEATIYIIVHLESKSRKFSVGIRCKPQSWNEKLKRIKGNSKDVKDKNLIIANSLSRMNDIIVRYRLQDEILTYDLLKNEWKNPSRRINFYAFYDEVLAEKKADLAPGTYRHHESFRTKLKSFRPELNFSEINLDFIKGFNHYLKYHFENDTNTIHTNLKRFRSYLNVAILKGIITKNPFDDYKIKTVQVDRVFLTSNELKIIWDRYLKKDLSPTNQRVTRHFLFMCFTGVRISDFKRLELDHISSNSIFFVPFKTKNSKRNIIRIPLNKYAIKLIKDEPKINEKLFNPVSDQKMNEYIKDVVKQLKIKKDVSNHTARHTFATLFLEKTKDLAALQQILGHSNIRETMQYIHVTDKAIKDSMNEFTQNVF